MRFIEVTIRTGELIRPRYVNLDHLISFQQSGSGTLLFLTGGEMMHVEEALELVKSMVFSHIPI